MENENNTISQISKKKMTPLTAGLLTVVAVLSLGASLGIVTGVIDVPFAEACCIIPPPIILPPPIVIIPPTTILIPSCELEITATTASSATLSWAVVNTVNASIDNGVGGVAIPSGSVDVSPSVTTTYTMTVQGPGGQANCDVTVTVTPPPPPVTPAPVCALAANPTSFVGSGQPTLTWTTSNATSFTIDQGVGSVTPVASGSVLAATITTTTTYTGTATGPGGTVTCSAPVTVTPPPLVPNAPVCTLTASPTTFVGSGAPTLTWTTQNATSFVINQGIGSVTPVAGGSQLAPTISVTTTYTGVATGPGGTSAPCTATVTVTPPSGPNVPICTLTASPTSFVGSGRTTLTWTTQNATSFTIDQSIGSVTPVAGGSVLAPTITTTTTYTGVATGPGGTSAPCTATVTVTPTSGPPAPICTLSAAPTSLPVGGGTTVLTWTTVNVSSFTIDNSIGAVTPVAGGNVTSGNITSDTTFTGTAVGTNGATITCTAPVTVQTGGGGCTSNCGGGGGSHPRVFLDVATPQALGFVYLSQIPYTGLDLGPVGTVVYWIVLVVWSLALAYLVLFVAFPYLARRAQSFGTDVKTALNNAPQLAPATVPAYASYRAPAGAPQVHKSVATEPRRNYSSFDGFRSFAAGEALSIDDIVNGLAREHAPEPKHNVEPVYQNVEPIYENVETIRAAAPVKKEAAQVHPDVPAFLTALIHAEREAVFGMFREIVRAGADAEAFLTQVACALDDAYRARLEGTPVHTEVKRITDPVATNVLEKLVTSLASAVDSSYSVGITGAKLALTRALAVVAA